MTIHLNTEILDNAVKPDPAQRLLRRLADRIESYFRVPVIAGEENQLVIQPWTTERIVVHVIDRSTYSTDMQVLVLRQNRHEDPDAESGFSEWHCDWPSDPENYMETWHWGDPQDRLDTGVSAADDLSSFLTDWLTHARATHLIR